MLGLPVKREPWLCPYVVRTPSFHTLWLAVYSISLSVPKDIRPLRTMISVRLGRLCAL